ncbi:hypothetical protein CPB97_010681 [Podila verticillata]|nr:hypothetical protein CPB97_010681 [Podila verticillata]
MFEIQKLNKMVCEKLDQGSLARCAQVSKEWNWVFAPYVWRTIPKYRWYDQWRALRQLVLEDYYQQQHPLDQQHAQAQPILESWQTNDPLALTKYGQFVRQVDGFTLLLQDLGPEFANWSGPCTTEYAGPSASDLARHFLKRCPNALLHFDITYDHITSVDQLRLAVEALPRVHTLVISGREDKPFPVLVLKLIFAEASHCLHSLVIDVHKLEQDMRCEAIETGRSVIARPKFLEIRALQTDSVVDLSWIWRACDQLEKIEICRVDQDVVYSLSQGIRTWMPRLDTVVFDQHGVCDWIPDSMIGHILATVPRRWKSVDCGLRAQVGPLSFAALLLHTSTLEELAIADVQDITGIVRVLQSCTKLRKLVAVDRAGYGWWGLPEVDATDLIDWDPEREVLWPWPCRKTLETLAIVHDVAPETFQATDEQTGDQLFAETQLRICERLGELTRLKVLRLCNRSWDESRSVHLTVDTGLRKLDGMTRLQEVCLPYLRGHVTRQRDLAWMVEHWPKLSKLELFPSMKAYTWLEQYHPEIHLESTRPPPWFHSPLSH